MSLYNCNKVYVQKLVNYNVSEVDLFAGFTLFTNKNNIGYSNARMTFSQSYVNIESVTLHTILLALNQTRQRIKILPDNNSLLKKLYRKSLIEYGFFCKICYENSYKITLRSKSSMLGVFQLYRQPTINAPFCDKDDIFEQGLEVFNSHLSDILNNSNKLSDNLLIQNCWFFNTIQDHGFSKEPTDDILTAEEI